VRTCLVGPWLFTLASARRPGSLLRPHGVRRNSSSVVAFGLPNPQGRSEVLAERRRTRKQFDRATNTPCSGARKVGISVTSLRRIILAHHPNQSKHELKVSGDAAKMKVCSGGKQGVL